MNLLIIFFSILCIAGTLLPMIDSKLWIIRGQANFKAQYLLLNFVMLLLVLIYLPFSIVKILLGIILSLNIFLCLKAIAPYSILFPKTIKNAKTDAGDDLKILVHNVYQYNNEYQKEIDIILEEDPDVVVLIEINRDWDKALSSLKEVYPYIVKEIREDTYGILMMSKLSASISKINHLVSKDMPSAEMLVIIDDKPIRILGIHPKPPIPGEVLTSRPKDQEILNAAQYIRALPKEEIKVLVGDFNDVAWSKVSKKFKELTGLKDVRVGRGFFSTFPAYSPLQIPLDHVFCSSEMTIVEFKTLKPLGSDHNPVSVTFKIPK